MKIKLKLYATLSDYLPQNALKQQIEIEIADDEAPNQVFESLNLPKEQLHLVLLNGIYLDEDHRNQRCLQEGDTLAVWPPVAGG